MNFELQGNNDIKKEQVIGQVYIGIYVSSPRHHLIDKNGTLKVTKRELEAY